MKDKEHRKHSKQDPEVDGLFMLAAAMSGDSIDNIVDSAGRGTQQRFCCDEQLPSEMGKDDKEILEGWGFKFSDEPSSDPLFLACRFPEGWKKKPTEHYMYSHVVDDKGRQRARIMYKPEWYDRASSMFLHRRFSVLSVHDAEQPPYAQSQVFDGGEVVYISEKHEFPDPNKIPRTSYGVIEEEHRPAYEAARDAEDAAKEASRKECADWLEKDYPDWKSSAAYWD